MLNAISVGNSNNTVDAPRRSACAYLNTAAKVVILAPVAAVSSFSLLMAGEILQDFGFETPGEFLDACASDLYFRAFGTDGDTGDLN